MFDSEEEENQKIAKLKKEGHFIFNIENFQLLQDDALKLAVNFRDEPPLDSQLEGRLISAYAELSAAASRLAVLLKECRL